jgi:hypothetical protein
MHDWHSESFRSGEAAEIDWEHVDWAQLQQECLQRNALRYSTTEPNEKSIWGLYKSLDPEMHKAPPPESSLKHLEETRKAAQPKPKPRTGVILRSWIGMEYTENDLYNIRSMIMELSLYSGGEYEVILLVDCQDKQLPKEKDDAAWTAFKEKHLPQELRGLAVFFNNKMLKDWYPEIDVHVYVFSLRKRGLFH